MKPIKPRLLIGIILILVGVPSLFVGNYYYWAAANLQLATACSVNSDYCAYPFRLTLGYPFLILGALTTILSFAFLFSWWRSQRVNSPIPAPTG